MKFELTDLFLEASGIMESDYTWEEKYDLIFSEEISKKVFAITPGPWYDPDTSYQEDVEAFYNQLKDYVKEETKKMDIDLKPWIEALRSENYPQTQETLCDKPGFCCLGVAAIVYDVATQAEMQAGEGPGWVYEKLQDMIPEEIYQDGINMNDAGDSFSEIADMIEAKMYA